MTKINENLPRILVIIFIMTLSFSCHKSDIQIKTSANLDQSNDYHFLNQKLKEVALAMNPVIQNPQKRSIIKQLVKQKFDNEYNLLINNIFNDARLLQSISKEKIDEIHSELATRASTRIYPQIYIPRFQFLEDNENVEQTVETEEEPVLVFYSGDPASDSAITQNAWPGYHLINDTTLQFYTYVDEDYANEHEVWVYSINESVDENGKLPVPCDMDPCQTQCAPTPECGGGGGGGGGGSENPDDDPTDAPAARNDFPDLGHLKLSFKIEYMAVGDFKEHWIGGKSEIAIRAKLVTHNGRHLGIPGSYREEYTSDQYSNYLGRLIRKFSRKEIKRRTVVYVNYPMQTNWQFEVISQDPVHFIYTIFERDIFPATLNHDTRGALPSQITNEPPPEGFPLWYRSSQNEGRNWPYARYHFTNTTTLALSADSYAGTGYVSNSDIAFNTVLFW